MEKRCAPPASDGVACGGGVRIPGPRGQVPFTPYSVDFDLPSLKLSGVGNVFKRVTSIAQVNGSGSSGVKDTMGWSDLRLGLTSSSGLHWGQTAPDVAEDCVTAKTQVASTSSSSEEVYIRLR